MFVSNIFLLCMIFGICLTNEKDVAEYTDSDFSTYMAEHETALVMFYAPWCGHCKNLKPEFAKAAQELKTNDPPVALIKVDCTEEGKDTCNTYDVSGYPTLKIFRNGKMSQSYSGPRDASGIVNYMKMQVGPNSKEFAELSELENYLSENVVSVVGFFQEDTDLKKAFLETADGLREKTRFAHTSSQNALKKYEVNDDILLFRPAHLRNKFEEDAVKFSGNASVDVITEFIQSNHHGLVGHRIGDNREDFKMPNVIAYYNIDYKKNPKGTNYWRNRMLKVAKQYKDKLTFAISPLSELQEYGDIPFKNQPIVFAKHSDDEKYKMEDDFSIDSLEDFVSNFLAKKLKLYVKSEPIPETNDENVKIAVRANFDELVTNNEKDVLIKFYSPWCGHCKRLIPVFEELAEVMKNEDIAIVKMDATANDVPSLFKVEGYPTIYWIRSDSKDKPTKYEEGRELSDFTEYIAKYATNELKGYDRKGKSKQKTEL